MYCNSGKNVVSAVTLLRVAFENIIRVRFYVIQKLYMSRSLMMFDVIIFLYCIMLASLNQN